MNNNPPNPTPSVTEAMISQAKAAFEQGEGLSLEYRLGNVLLAMRAADQPPSDDEYKLPCDVRLPPATVIKAGCSLATLKLAIELEGRPKEFRTDQPPPYTGLTDVERVADHVEKRQLDAGNRYTRPETERFVRLTLEAIAAMPQQPVHADVERLLARLRERDQAWENCLNYARQRVAEAADKAELAGRQEHYDDLLAMGRLYGEAADVIAALLVSNRSGVEEIEQVISAWAFAHDIDGAARNDLFKRIRTALDTEKEK